MEQTRQRDRGRLIFSSPSAPPGGYKTTVLGGTCDWVPGLLMRRLIATPGSVIYETIPPRRSSVPKQSRRRKSPPDEGLADSPNQTGDGAVVDPSPRHVILTVSFDAIEQDLRHQADDYRARHLSVKLSLYSGFFSFQGLALAAAALVASRAPYTASAVIGLTLISTSTLFLLHHWFLRMFDVLGYTKISIASQSDLDAHHRQMEEAFSKFKRVGPWRKIMDKGLFAATCVQIILLALSTWTAF